MLKSKVERGQASLACCHHVFSRCLFLDRIARPAFLKPFRPPALLSLFPPSRRMDMTQHDIFTPYSSASLSVDSMGSQTDDESSNPSPAADSPRLAFPKNTGIDGKLQDRNASPSSLPDAAAKPEKEKRKRSRVTPEQLVHLERFFVIDRSPTAARRRDISELLGMQERQTQIWFQNRYASDPFLPSPK